MYLVICVYSFGRVYNKNLVDCNISWFYTSPKSIYHLDEIKRTSSNPYYYYGIPIKTWLHYQTNLRNSPWIVRYARNGLTARGNTKSNGFKYVNDSIFLPEVWDPDVFDQDKQIFRFKVDLQIGKK